MGACCLGVMYPDSNGWELCWDVTREECAMWGVPGGGLDFAPAIYHGDDTYCCDGRSRGMGCFGVGQVYCNRRPDDLPQPPPTEPPPTQPPPTEPPPTESTKPIRYYWVDNCCCSRSVCKGEGGTVGGGGSSVAASCIPSCIEEKDMWGGVSCNCTYDREAIGFSLGWTFATCKDQWLNDYGSQYGCSPVGTGAELTGPIGSGENTMWVCDPDCRLIEGFWPGG